MSFPIVHSMIGYSVYRVGKDKNRCWQEAVFFAFAATAADADFIPGLLVGNPFLFHHSITHSIGFALIFGLVVASLVKIFKKGGFSKPFLLSFAVYATHPLVDLLTSPTRIPLLWPLQSAGLTQQLTTFWTLPLCRDGFKDFACGLVLNLWCVQRFWREIFFLGAAASIFFFQAALSRLFATLKRRSVLPDAPAPYVE